MRTPQQVAKRALISTCLALRASLEVTEHPRAAGISRNILPWLSAQGISPDPIEQEILETPYRQLTKDQQADAYWSGEAAWVFAWALGVVERPPKCEVIDPQILIQRLEVLHHDATRFIASAALRPKPELVEFCVETLSTRNELQKLRIPEAPTQLLSQLLINRLSEIGLPASEPMLASAARFADTLTAEGRERVAGLYFVRDHAVTWLFDSRATYFGRS